MTDLQRRLLADDNVTKTGTLLDADLIPVERAGVTIGVYGSAIQIGGKFDTVTDMLAETGLTIGTYVTTRGHTDVGDYKGAPFPVYKIVADGTGTVDNVSILQCTGTTVRAQLQHSGTIWAEWGGAVDDVEASTQLQAAWDALVAWQDADGNEPGIMLHYHSRCALQNQVKFRRASDGSRVLNANLDFTGSMTTAVGGGDLTDSNAMFLVRLRGVQYWGNMSGGKFAQTMDMNGMSGSRSYHPRVWNFKGHGIQVRGANGSFIMFAPNIQEYISSDAEFNTQSNFTANGLTVETGDWTCYNANILYCKKCLAIEDDCVQFHFVEGHPVNGNVNDGEDPFVDGILIENNSTRQNHIHGAYLDNGVVNDYTGTLNIIGGHYVKNGLATITEPKIRVYASSVGQTTAPEGRVVNVGGKASIGFLDNGANTWAGDLSGLAALYNDMKDRDKSINYHQKIFNLILDEDDEVEYTYKIGGTIGATYAVGTDEITLDFDPTGNEVSVDPAVFRVSRASTTNQVIVGSGTVGIGEIDGEGGKLEFYAGGAQQWHIQSGGNLRPAANGTQHIGGASNKIDAVYLTALLGLPTHADNAAASGAGLAVGDVYQTATGELRIVV